jgi:hypothetical protein
MRRPNSGRGPKPKWKFTQKTGMLERKASKGSIDWYRYYKVILEGKLFPFAKKCKAKRPGTIVQEDNASPYSHHYQRQAYSLWQIMKLLWPSNSPDLNAIEPTWDWMKRKATEKGAATSEKCYGPVLDSLDDFRTSVSPLVASGLLLTLTVQHLSVTGLYIIPERNAYSSSSLSLL